MTWRARNAASGTAMTTFAQLGAKLWVAEVHVEGSRCHGQERGKDTPRAATGTWSSHIHTSSLPQMSTEQGFGPEQVDRLHRHMSLREHVIVGLPFPVILALPRDCQRDARAAALNEVGSHEDAAQRDATRLRAVHCASSAGLRDLF